MTKRLIESWLPIAELGVESLRERTPMTPYPAPNRLHVWWARRPLVASRAAILGSLLPADSDRKRFLHVLGIHGDPVGVRRQIDKSRKTGQNLGPNPFGYDRAFKYSPDADDREWVNGGLKALGLSNASVLDPTSGGGSIPLESIRLGFSTFANDLNPVAVTAQQATFMLPLKHGAALASEFDRISRRFLAMVSPKLQSVFPAEANGEQVLGYLWTRTIRCPHCEAVVPLSPNWRLAPDGTGVRLLPVKGRGPGDRSRHIQYELVSSIKEQSAGTVSGGDATCPMEDCDRLISGDFIKSEAQAGRMGEQLYGVVLRTKTLKVTKSGRARETWGRTFRAPRHEDDVAHVVDRLLGERGAEWEALDIIPSEAIGELSNYDRGHRMYGMYRWTDMFSPRQLFGHAIGVETLRALLSEESVESKSPELTKAAFLYLAMVIDKFLGLTQKP